MKDLRERRGGERELSREAVPLFSLDLAAASIRKDT
jgi:hypothetical protein